MEVAGLPGSLAPEASGRLADFAKVGGDRILDRLAGVLKARRSVPLFCIAGLSGIITDVLLSGPLTGQSLLVVAVAGLAGLLMYLSHRQQNRVLAEMRSQDERLAAQSAMLQSTLENMGEGISVFDRDGRLIAWNSQFARFLSLPVKLPAATLRDILSAQARRGDFGAVDDLEREVGERVEIFYRNLPTVIERPTLDGRTLLIRRRAMPNGGVVSMYSDITEQKASVAKMELARDQAEFANQAKSDFLANMSHELRTPLNAIIGFSEVIASEILGPVADQRQLEYIRDIHASGLLLLSIINDVLDMSKIEAGKLELMTEAVDLPRLVGDAIRIVGERARERGVVLALNMPADTTAISGDERAIKQIMLNLLSNAVKFSNENGQIDIRLKPEAGCVVLEVEDYGIGMTPQEMERALQPFGQAKPATIRTYGGTGLGLPIAKGLVEAHGGTLTLESTSGQGTLVQVTLPQKTAKIPEVLENLLVEFS